MTKGLLFKLQDELLEEDFDVEFVDMDTLPHPDGALIQGYLQEKTGQRTVPNIFIATKHIGGNSDLQQLHKMGKLEGMLMEISLGVGSSGGEL